MTGWRLGWAAGPAELIQALTKVKTYIDTGPFLATQQAAITALERGDRFLASTVAELTERRDAGVAALREAGFAVESPQATMYLWVPLPREVPSGLFARRVLEEAGVVVLPGSGFGPGGEGFFRIALTVGAGRLAEAAVRLGRVLAQSREGAVASAR
jgi:LL-diaminopimelate aminotransferase